VSKPKRTADELVTIELAQVRALIERIKPDLSEVDFQLLSATTDVLEKVTRELRKRGATIARLRSMLGQRSSEKTADLVGNAGGSESASTEPSPSADTDATHPQSPSTPTPRPKRKGHGRIPASSYDCEVTAVPHPTLCPGQQCPACTHGSLYDTDDPAPAVIIVGQPLLAAERFDGQCLRCNSCGKQFTAPLPERARGPKYTASAAATITVSHYWTGIPFNRLEAAQEFVGVPVPAATQWQVISNHLPLVMPVYHVLASMAADAPLVQNDDTHVKILELMGKRRRELEAAGELVRPDRTGLFTTAVVAETYAGSIVLFASGRAHAGENLADLLDRRGPELPPPIQMCDGLDRNLPEDHAVIHANCLSHARRKFVDEVNNYPQICEHLLKQVGKVFHNEQVCTREGLVGSARLELHQRESGPVMQDLKKWLDELLASKTVEPNSDLGSALSYMTKRWDKLTVFLRVPGAPIDNNIVERTLKSAIRLRRASLFYATTSGALAGDVFLALIHTTLLHGGNPLRYLTALFIHYKEVEAAPEDWLPWNYEAAMARLDEREMRAA
jgi:hypothetical protein